MAEIVAVGFCGVCAALSAFFGGACMALCREKRAAGERQKKQERKSAEEAQRMNRELLNFLNYDGTRQQDPSEEA